METHFARLVHFLHLCTQREGKAAMEKLGITPSQGHLMGYLTHAQEPPCPRDLEAAFHLSHATVSGLLYRMEQKGLLELRPDPLDRRCKRIFLLPKGLELDGQICQTLMESNRRMVQDFTQQEQAQFVSFLRRAICNMGGGEERCPDKEECDP